MTLRPWQKVRAAVGVLCAGVVRKAAEFLESPQDKRERLLGRESLQIVEARAARAIELAKHERRGNRAWRRARATRARRRAMQEASRRQNWGLL